MLLSMGNSLGQSAGTQGYVVNVFPREVSKDTQSVP